MCPSPWPQRKWSTYSCSTLDLQILRLAFRERTGIQSPSRYQCAGLSSPFSFPVVWMISVSLNQSLPSASLPDPQASLFLCAHQSAPSAGEASLSHHGQVAGLSSLRRHRNLVILKDLVDLWCSLVFRSAFPRLVLSPVCHLLWVTHLDWPTFGCDRYFEAASLIGSFGFQFCPVLSLRPQPLLLVDWKHGVCPVSFLEKVSKCHHLYDIW